MGYLFRRLKFGMAIGVLVGLTITILDVALGLVGKLWKNSKIY